MTSLVVRKMINGRTLKLKLVPVVRKVIGEGLVKLERVQVICPACGQQLEAVATGGRVKGYCAVAKQSVDFLIKKIPVSTGRHLTAEHRAKISMALTGKHPTTETRAKISAALTRRHNIEKAGLLSSERSG
ncbi:MAG TPA: NUMOD3 domain-containing DNA-binding protein [Dehalococcoidales bacterium]|nr:NUMOD3 domain-containing DNA-binding protein [Dehalococcoidales bacterium]